MVSTRWWSRTQIPCGSSRHPGFGTGLRQSPTIMSGHFAAAGLRLAITVRRGLKERSTHQELRGLVRLRGVQLFALSFLLILGAAIAFVSRTTVRDPDIWWHLKTGDWIVQHHAVPYVGIFSHTAASRPWIAYSWGYEVLMSFAYSWFGLIGFAMFGILLTMAVTFALFWMLHRLSRSFWLAWLLALVGSFAFLFSLMPRPVFVTMILFAVVLTFLLEAQRTGRMRLLWWLPLVFVLWANIHIQFIYGLAVLGLFMGINLV